MLSSSYKILTGILIYIYFSSFAYSNGIKCNGFNFVKGQKGFLISNSVNLRNFPNIKSNKITSLPLGVDIEIINSDSNCLNLGAKKGIWLNVKVIVDPYSHNVNVKLKNNKSKYIGWIYSPAVVVKSMFKKITYWDKFKSYNVEYGDSLYEYKIDKNGKVKEYAHNTYDGDGNTSSKRYVGESHLYQYKNYLYISYNKVIRYGKNKYCNIESFKQSENTCYGENHIKK